MTVPLLRYPGSKNQLASWILSYLPAHDSYLEPYCGSCAVLFAKKRSPIEAVNDKSNDIVNLLRMLRERPDELIEQIRWTPWATAEYTLAHEPAADPLEQARRFYFRCWASIRPFADTPSFRRQKKLSRGRNDDKTAMTAAAKTFMRTKNLWQIAERLRGVTIENLDAIEFIELYDNRRASFYIDPPYLGNTRSMNDHYRHEMTAVNEHEKLAQTLVSAKGMILLSHYPCPEYDDWYLTAGWQRHEREARINGGGSATEALYLNPAAVQRLTHADMPLFAQEAT